MKSMLSLALALAVYAGSVQRVEPGSGKIAVQGAGGQVREFALGGAPLLRGKKPVPLSQLRPGDRVRLSLNGSKVTAARVLPRGKPKPKKP